MQDEAIKFGGKTLTEFTDRELLKLLAEKAKRHNDLLLDEQDFIDSHDGRDFWDDGTEEEYQSIVGDVLTAWREVEAICKFAEGLR